MKRKKKKRQQSHLPLALRLLLTIVLFALAGGIIYLLILLGGRIRQKDLTRQEQTAMAIDLEEKAREEAARAEAERQAQAEEQARKEKEAEEAAKVSHAGDVELKAGYKLKSAKKMLALPPAEEVMSERYILVNLSNNRVILDKGGEDRIVPASMTKILTCLVAAEHIEDLDAPFTLTQEMEEYCLLNGGSAAGFRAGETVPVRDLFYGSILPSGGEAAVALATAAAGSHEAFVDLMNQKLEELGLADTAHFTNCVGLYDEDHYCTLRDMAVILKAAIENDWAREVLSTHDYETTHTEQNPDGLILHNWFLCRIEDYETAGEVVAAKTGFVDQAGMCAASYKVSNTGVPYICVTENTYSEWRSIYDHIYIYANDAP